MDVRALGRKAGTWFPLIVLAAGAVAVWQPDPFIELAPAVPWLLATIMLGMGLTLKPSDFATVATRPLPLALGVVAQFLIMPLIGFALAKTFDLSPALAVGVILVGAAPGGTASNVMVYLAKGDTALSVSMTTVSTLLAPLLTPLVVLWLAGDYLPVDTRGLLVSIAQIVLVPIALGVMLRLLLPRVVERLLDVMPLVSVVGITLVVLAVVAGSADTVLSAGLLVAVVVVLHNGFGLLLGYLAARAAGMDETVRRAVSIEIGMQNSGLAAGLAAIHFSPAAALPAALFSVWHNVSGSLLAGWWSRRTVPEDADAS
ncbi:bile acid:sodium symporter family protein [Aeromicrobium sp. CTD01-1L150]|uniref:bile acid:sodium symporter family protein n=1 Tax=Aeromicrobium sp. CTD01-1L150 TaxID=3341830 RepID=UPI0035BF9399